MQRIIRNSLFKTNKGKSAYSLRNGALACILVAGALLGGCTKDDTGTGNGKITGESELTVKLRVPSVTLPTSRAMAFEDENHLKTVDVLAFSIDKDETDMDKSKFAYRTYGTVINDDGSKDKTIRTKLKVNDDATDNTRYHFVFIANARTELNDLFTELEEADELENMLKPALLSQIQFAAYPENASDDEGRIWPTSVTNMRYLPMWGELSGSHAIMSGDNIPTVGTVQMIRAVARVNIRFKDETKDRFKVREIHVNHITPEGTVVPVGNFNYTTNKVTAPTLPNLEHLTEENKKCQPAQYTLKKAVGEGVQGDENEHLQNGLDYSGEWSAAIDNTFYVPEHKNIGIQHIDRLCVLVFGSYREENDATDFDDITPTWYRVDFFDQQGDMLDVLRNHSYNFHITSIDGEGNTDKEEALKDKPYNIKTEVFVWDDQEMEEVYYDGMHYYSVAPREHRFGYLGTTSEGSRTIKVQTDSKYRHVYVTLKDGDENFFTGGIVPQPTPFPPGQEPDEGETYIVEIPFDIPEYVEANVPEFKKRELTIYINFKSQHDLNEKDKVRIPIKIIQTNDMPEFKIVKKGYVYESGNGNPYDNYAWVFFNVEGYFDASKVIATMDGVGGILDPCDGRSTEILVYPGENSYTGTETDIQNFPYKDYDQGVRLRLPYYGENGFITREQRDNEMIPIFRLEKYAYQLWVEIQGERTRVVQLGGANAEIVNFITLPDINTPDIWGLMGNELTFTVGGKWQRPILWVLKDGTGENANIIGNATSHTSGEEITINVDANNTGVARNVYLYFSLTNSYSDLESCQVQSDYQNGGGTWTYQDGVQQDF